MSPPPRPPGPTSGRVRVSWRACVHVGVKGVHQQAAGRLSLRDVGGVLLHLDDLSGEAGSGGLRVKGMGKGR
jgi:hypothetical protein